MLRIIKRFLDKENIQKLGFCEGQNYELIHDHYSWCAYQYLLIDKIKDGNVSYRNKSDLSILILYDYYTIPIKEFKGKIKYYKLITK